MAIPLYGSTAATVPGMSLGFAPKKRDWRARLFDRLAGSDAGEGLSDQQKSSLGRQGLLQLGIGLLQNNNFHDALGQGLQGGLLAMNQGADDIRNAKYQKAIQQRMLGNAAREQQITALRGRLAGADGAIDESAFRQYAALDPEGAKAYRDAIQPRTRYQTGQLTTPTGNLPYFFDPENPLGAFDLGGQPLYGGNMPTGGAATAVMQPELFRAIEAVESGGNPYAVSPKGAVGPMQTMPGTLRSPGFGVAPAKDGSITEQRRVGQDYAAALQQKYGPVGGLAAYNWGPGNWEMALASAGGNVEAALARAPKETRDYVPKVMAQMQSGGDPFASRPGFQPNKPKFQSRKLSSEEVASNGFPAGTVAYTTESGKPDIVYTPSDRGPEVDDGMSPGERKDVRKEFYGIRQALVNFQNLDKALADVPQSGALDPESKGRLGTSYNNARAALRLVYNTGVLQPGELPMLESALRDPSGYSVMLDPRLRGQMRGQLDELYRALNSQIGLITETYPGMFNPDRMREGGALLKEARAAVANGKDKEAVRQRLRQLGYANLAKVL